MCSRSMRAIVRRCRAGETRGGEEPRRPLVAVQCQWAHSSNERQGGLRDIARTEDNRDMDGEKDKVYKIAFAAPERGRGWSTISHGSRYGECVRPRQKSPANSKSQCQMVSNSSPEPTYLNCGPQTAVSSPPHEVKSQQAAPVR